MFFSGVYFPVSILPKYLQGVAKFVPFYYSIEGVRISIVSPSEFIQYLVILILGIYSLRKGLEKAMKEGSLAFY